MHYIDQGHGSPLVFVPGAQGRWEYMRATIDALSTRFRVITFSLGDEPTAAFPFDSARGFDSYADQIAAVLDAAGIRRAAICGLSFGGLIALRFAAQYADRVNALVLVSTPGPGWRLRPRHDFYARLPWIFGPLFMLEAPFRARRELAVALPRLADRWRFARTIMTTSLKAPLSMRRMATRGRAIASYDMAGDCTRVAAPTLVVTGEPDLDYVVSAEGTSQYARLIAGAETAVLQRTGHQGTLTRPDAFADTVQAFVARVQPSRDGRVA